MSSSLDKEVKVGDVRWKEKINHNASLAWCLREVLNHRGASHQILQANIGELLGCGGLLTGAGGRSAY